jgi:hypothetical protein
MNIVEEIIVGIDGEKMEATITMTETAHNSIRERIRLQYARINELEKALEKVNVRLITLSICDLQKCASCKGHIGSGLLILKTARQESSDG